MKVTFQWLKQYVDFSWSPAELAERLTMLGLEVEGVQSIAGEFAGIVVGQVLTRDKHPNADKLSLCRVHDGKGERQIVCGAQNFQAGDKVPVILPGASLPAKPGQAPFAIKVGKIRGVESHGMMCSPLELGLSDDAEGLLILRPDAQVGQPFADYLGRSAGDVVYDLEITPNRPDWNSALGIAREIASLTGNPLRWPDVDPGALDFPEPSHAAILGALAAVRIEDADLCPRYTARAIRGVTIGPSPDWLRTALEKVGLRSINNVVDVTNYVMLETGQPLHAFDLERLAVAPGQLHPTLVVRRATPDETFVTLDGQPRQLDADMLMIADETRSVALAGVMGGQNSEIHEQTRDVLLESACFKPSNIRRTSKRLGLKTDASYRFERGADVGICNWASLRAAQFIVETAGGELVPGVADVLPRVLGPQRIALRHSAVLRILGVEIPPDDQRRLLEGLAIRFVETTSAASEPAATFSVPSFRVDLKREIDLVEELARLYGVDRIPSSPPRGAIGENSYDATHDLLAEIRRLLIGLGLHEAQGQTLIGASAADLVRPTAPGQDLARLSHPLSSDMNTLRPSLLPGLIDSLRHNVSRKNLDVALFEVGRVFATAAGRFTEGRRVALAMTGQRAAPFWSGAERDARCDVFDLKGLVEECLESFGVRGFTFVKQAAPGSLFLASALVQLGRQSLGELGQLQPQIARQHDLRDPVYLAELDLDLLIARRNPGRAFRPLPVQPAIRRDVALVVAEETTHDAVVAAVRASRPAHLEGLELFDVFRGEKLPPGQKSMAYAFLYRHAERTLTDAEVNAAHEKLVAELTQKLAASIRS